MHAPQPRGESSHTASDCDGRTRQTTKSEWVGFVPLAPVSRIRHSHCIGREQVRIRIAFLTAWQSGTLSRGPAKHNNTDADARHREDLARASEERQLLSAQQSGIMLKLLEQNTRLTELTKEMTERVEALTAELHGRLVKV